MSYILILICILQILYMSSVCSWPKSGSDCEKNPQIVCTLDSGNPWYVGEEFQGSVCMASKLTHLDVPWGNRESHMLMLSYGTLNNLVVLWSCAMLVSCQRSQFSIWFRRLPPMCGRSTEFFLSHDDQFLRDLYLNYKHSGGGSK